MTAEPVVELRLTYACGRRVTLYNTWPESAYTSLCAEHHAPVRISCELKWRRADDIELAKIAERDAYV